MAREHKAREPEREEGGMLEDGVGVIREEVLDPGGEVRLLAGAAVEAEAHPVERGLVGAPFGLERRGDGGAGGGQSGDDGDVVEGEGGLAPGEGEGGGGGGPEGGEVEDVGGVGLDPVGGGEDGVVDAEAAPERGVKRAELGDPDFPVARGAKPTAEVEAVLGGGDGLGWGRGAERGRRGRRRGAVERGQEMGEAALVGPVHVDGELVDEDDHITVVIVGGGHDRGGGEWAAMDVRFLRWVLHFYCFRLGPGGVGGGLWAWMRD